MSTPRAILFILVGPGDRELRRFRDVIASLCFAEPAFVAASTLLVINDNTADVHQVAPRELGAFANAEVISNPYNGAAHPVLPYDRILAGALAALRRATELPPHDFVMKIDTDALVCGRFAERVVRFLQSHPDAGMIGTFRHDPDGRPRNTEGWWDKAIRRTCGWLPTELIRFHRQHRLPFRAAVVLRRWWRRHRLVRQAERTGWRVGEHVLGGAYALSPAVIEQFKARPEILADVRLFEGTRISDDVGVSILVPALGLRLQACNGKGDIFGIWYQKPTLPIAQLVADGYAFVHSIKAQDAAEEDAMRRDFARNAAVPLESCS